MRVDHGDIRINDTDRQCSNSLSALKAISAQEIPSSTVLDYRGNVELLVINNSVTLMWVPGHSGI